MIAECLKVHDVERILSADAGNDADLPGVFAATHRPVAGVRKQSDAASEKLSDAAEDALRAIAADVSHENPIVIPVLGEAGTGKSHLVRWVWTQFVRLDRKEFVVVYVLRARMSMAGVVARLLAAARDDDDPVVSEAAKQLIAAAKDMFEDRCCTSSRASFGTSLRFS